MNSFTRRLALLAIGAASAISPALVDNGSASAASGNYWAQYDVDRSAYDYCRNDAAAFVDAYGRVTATVYFDLDNNCQWDTLARDTDGNGSVDEVWFDVVSPGGGGWDTLVRGNMRYDNQNGWSASGLQYSGPYGTYWGMSGFTYSIVGGTPSGSFYNLMATLASFTGYAVG